MIERLLYGLCAFVTLAAAAILLVGYGELRAARQCSVIVDGSLP